MTVGIQNGRKGANGHDLFLRRDPEGVPHPKRKRSTLRPPPLGDGHSAKNPSPHHTQKGLTEKLADARSAPLFLHMSLRRGNTPCLKAQAK